MKFLSKCYNSFKNHELKSEIESEEIEHSREINFRITAWNKDEKQEIYKGIESYVCENLLSRIGKEDNLLSLN